MSKTAKTTSSETRTKQESRNRENDEVTFVIQEHLGVLSTNKWGWTREVNLVSWNGNPGKLDIRNWNPEHSKMGRGITFNGTETAYLLEILKDFDIAAAGI